MKYDKTKSIKNYKKALKLFIPIPEKNWTTHIRTNDINQCCALGHWDRLTSNNPNDYSWNNCLRTGLEEINILREAVLVTAQQEIALVNNDYLCKIFPQKTPKGRVIACLEKILKENNVEIKYDNKN